jgi:hypothetical protein
LFVRGRCTGTFYRQDRLVAITGKRSTRAPSDNNKKKYDSLRETVIAASINGA